jgi:hypothetical protein
MTRNHGRMDSALALCAVAAFLVVLMERAAAQSDEQVSVPLSDPGGAVTLEVSLVFGGISVTGYDGDEVIIALHESPVEEPDAPAPGGLTRLHNTSIGLTAEESNNTVSIGVEWTGRDVQLDISAPRRTSVRARTVNGGDLTIEGVIGDHELSNVNGHISAADIAGSMVADTTNGDVRVSFTELALDKPMSFSSFNGDVDVSFPQSLAAELRISAARGDVLTDFDVDIQARPSEVERSEDTDRYRIRLEREIAAVVGGGGPVMHFKTFNGNIVIRRR